MHFSHCTPSPMKAILRRLPSHIPALALAVLFTAAQHMQGESPKSPAAPARILPGEQPDGSVLVTTNQMVTPLGKVQKLPGERPKDMAMSPDGSLLAVLTTSKVNLFKLDGTLAASVPVKSSSLGLA